MCTIKDIFTNLKQNLFSYTLIVINHQLFDDVRVTSPKENVKIMAYSDPPIREIAEKQIKWVIGNS